MTIQVLDKKFQPYIKAAQIQEQVNKLAKQINEDYAGKKPLFIAILNGSFMFASDLFKELDIEAEICFIKLASYKGTKSTGNVITSIGLDTSLTGRHIVIVEDIVDTGKTLYEFLPQLINQQPASLKIAKDLPMMLYKDCLSIVSISEYLAKILLTFLFLNCTS